MKTKITSDYSTPILLIIYKREDCASQVIEAISKIRPKYLYISQDGPRNNEDKKKVMKTRKAVLGSIDWECDLKTHFYRTNLGVMNHPIKALDWFLGENTYGIYLEDDTLPSLDFFYFQAAMLKRYEKNNRIYMINGVNLFSKEVVPDYPYSYYLSRVFCGWGFGLYRRSWKLYDPGIKDFFKVKNKRRYKEYFVNTRYRYYAESFFLAIVKGRLKSTFTFQMLFNAAKQDMFFVYPSKNLVRNIGFNKNGSNPIISLYSKKYEEIFPLKHPNRLIYNKSRDIKYFNNLLKGGWLRVFAIRLYLFSPAWLKSIIENLTTNIFR